MEFNDYIFEISIECRHKDGPYNSDVIAQVGAKETLRLLSTDVTHTLSDLTRETLDKAQGAIRIRDDAARQLRALEAGDATYDEMQDAAACTDDD